MRSKHQISHEEEGHLYYITADRERWTLKKKEARVMARRLHELADFMLRREGKLSDNKDKAERFRKRASRMGACANQIVSRVCPQCNIRYISRVNLCRDRLCPVCAWRRGKALTARLQKIVSYNTEARYILLTLTVKNCEWNKLNENLRALLKAWGKLSRRVKFTRAVKGWVRTLEITRGKDGKAHPHLHILLQVAPEYFSKDTGVWLEHEELVRLWGRCLNVDYLPSVDIRAVKGKEIGKAILEVTKYLSKSIQIEGLSDVEFLDYVEAVSGVRAWAAGGTMREADHEIREEELLHFEEKQEERHTCPLCGQELVEMCEIWDNVLGSYDVLPDWGSSGITIINNGVINIVQTCKRGSLPPQAGDKNAAS